MRLFVYTICLVEVIFDPAKDAINRTKHGISLSRAEDFDFEAAFIRIDDREDYGETRYRAISFLEARVFVLVFAMQGTAVRAISLRKATRSEMEEYAKEQ